MMMRNMRASGHYLQVLYSIIRRIVIDMVNNLIRFKLPSQMLFHNPSMSPHLPARNADLFIGQNGFSINKVRVSLASKENAHTSSRAEMVLPGSYFMRNLHEHFAAGITMNSNLARKSTGDRTEFSLTDMCIKVFTALGTNSKKYRHCLEFGEHLNDMLEVSHA